METLETPQGLERVFQRPPTREILASQGEGWATVMIVRNEGGRTMSSEESVIDRKLGKALTAIDHATLALYLSRTAASQVQRVECAQRARVSFMAALAELDKAAPILKLRDAWLVWHDEAQNGLAAALSRLASLGVSTPLNA